MTIANAVGIARGAAIYEGVFTVWGLAGHAGPRLAGALYDRFQDYAYALAIAGLFGLVSALAASRLAATDADPV